MQDWLNAAQSIPPILSPEKTDFGGVEKEALGRLVDGQSGAKIFSETVRHQSDSTGGISLKITELFTLPQRLQATVEDAEKITRREFGILITLGGLLALTQKFLGDALKNIGDVLSLPSGYSVAKPPQRTYSPITPETDRGETGIAGGDSPIWGEQSDIRGYHSGYLAAITSKQKTKSGTNYAQELLFESGRRFPYKGKMLTDEDIYQARPGRIKVKGRKTGSRVSEYLAGAYNGTTQIDDIDVLEILEAK